MGLLTRGFSSFLILTGLFRGSSSRTMSLAFGTTTATTTTFNNRIAVVTGSNKGIGYYIALQLASSGLFRQVILGCRDSKRGGKAVEEIQSKCGKSRQETNVSFLPLTVGDKESHESFRRTVEDLHGQVDVLVNNAAIAYKGADPTPFSEQCKPTLDVNFRGTVDFTEELLPLIRKSNDNPRIVNVASMAGRLSQIRAGALKKQFSSSTLTLKELKDLVNQFEADVLNGKHVANGWGNSNYGFSKLAIIAATKVWARDEAANGIKINCCCPGYCDTDMTSHKGTRHANDGAKNAVLPATMEDCPTGEYFSNMQVSKW